MTKSNYNKIVKQIDTIKIMVVDVRYTEKWTQKAKELKAFLIELVKMNIISVDEFRELHSELFKMVGVDE